MPWVGTWRPHRPRGPISAQYRTPGPKYGLPTNVGYHRHDISRSRAPAYTFGLRLGTDQVPCSPGPRYLVPPGFTERGRDGIPAYSLSSRTRWDVISRTPGPAHYAPDQADNLAYPTSPAYSLRSRRRLDRPQATPGPANYTLPAVVGPGLVNKPSAPSYTMTSRGPSMFGASQRSPGPSHYNAVQPNVYMARAPRWSMLGQTPPLQPFATPSPSDYHPQLGREQGKTFGIKHSEYMAPVLAEEFE